MFNSYELEMLEFKTSDGVQLEARIIRLTPHLVTFEICGPEPVLRVSETLQSFQVNGESNVIFQGKATVTSILNDGARTIAEAALDSSFVNLELDRLHSPRQFIRDGFESFLKHRTKRGRINEEYRHAVGELRSLLHDLRRWADKIELAAHARATADPASLDRLLVQEFASVAAPCLRSAFEKFELAAAEVTPEGQQAHFEFCRRELHPYLMASPFMHRIYSKPLGYAGDYEMVNMILRDPHEGASFFGRLLNVFILDQAPARAHRNRVDYLSNCLFRAGAAWAARRRKLRVYNLGCGPAYEVQRFLSEQHLSNQSEFTLLDANEETLQFTLGALQRIAAQKNRSTQVAVVKRSVQQLLKGGSNPFRNGAQYEFIYSAGLFDYLNDRVCRLLVEQCYALLAPGGQLLVTNVDTCNPIRNIMEHIYEWFLIYRSGAELESLASGVPPEAERLVHADATSSNLFLEVRKPGNAK